eukprot:NODE_366_length_965_cov_258.150831_g359_i0.p1 GENE.NODE_366_length_965_cov_258.150831_g359_i0~~NODE_366_length_965_cov_258.150831_g359_i0.p1  ORF type:complete len:189 (-),score=9.46 NODE_366_length_965_cov_258.150831_g359_i0:316-882(-)
MVHLASGIVKLSDWDSLTEEGAAILHRSAKYAPPEYANRNELPGKSDSYATMMLVPEIALKVRKPGAVFKYIHGTDLYHPANEWPSVKELMDLQRSLREPLHFMDPNVLGQLHDLPQFREFLEQGLHPDPRQRASVDVLLANPVFAEYDQKTHRAALRDFTQRLVQGAVRIQRSFRLWRQNAKSSENT